MKGLHKLNIAFSDSVVRFLLEPLLGFRLVSPVQAKGLQDTLIAMLIDFESPFVANMVP